MKRFEFRLERPLKLKRQQQWLAEQLQRKAQAELDAARAVVQGLQNLLARIAALLDPDNGDPPNALSWRAYQHQSVLIARQLEAAEARARQAERKVEEANAQRLRITLGVEALVRLREQQLHEFRRELARARQTELDEIGLHRWIRQKALTRGSDLEATP